MKQNREESRYLQKTIYDTILKLVCRNFHLLLKVWTPLGSEVAAREFVLSFPVETLKKHLAQTGLIYLSFTADYLSQFVFSNVRLLFNPFSLPFIHLFFSMHHFRAIAIVQMSFNYNVRASNCNISQHSKHTY